MKKTTLAQTLLLSCALALSAPVKAADACEMVLCLAGEAMGQGGGGACKGAIRDYFKIYRNKDGKFSPSRTASDRAKKLNQCSGAPAATKSMIGSKYGRLRGL